MNNKINLTIKELIDTSVIPEKGYFNITEDILHSYIKVYGTLSKSNKIGSKSNLSLARRLAGINLLKLLIARGYRYTDIPSGMCYIIGNSAYPLHYKVGMTLDLDKRLSQYQTYDPYRAFKVEAYEFVLDRRASEKLIIKHPLITSEEGEWILKENALQLFHSLIKVI